MKIVNPIYNASHELAAFDGITLDQRGIMIAGQDLADEVRALPRIAPYTGSAAPRVSVDGQEYGLSYKFFTPAEKQTYKDYRSGHKGTASTGGARKPSVPENIVREVLALKELSQETRAFFESLLPKDPVTRILESAGFTPEQIAAVLAMKK